jgi:mevalonate kinase
LKEYFQDVENKNISQGMSAATFLLTNLVPSSTLKQCSAISLSVQSKGLPVGAGLGSSAAFSVALAAAYCKVRQHVLFPDQSSSIAECKSPGAAQLEVINRWAFASEVLLHGSPSGLDNTTSCFGGFVQFQRGLGETGAETRCERLVEGALPLRLLLCNTKVERSTKEQVGKVRQLLIDQPAVVEPVFAAIHAISLAFRRILTNGDTDRGCCAAANLSSTVRIDRCTWIVPPCDRLLLVT